MRSKLVDNIYATLRYEVERQQPSERIDTITSSGLPHYRIPREMDSKRGPCCYTRQPCEVHKMYCGGCGRPMLNPDAPCINCHWRG